MSHLDLLRICLLNDIRDLLVYQLQPLWIFFFPLKMKSELKLLIGCLNKEFLMTWAKGRQCKRNAAAERIQDSYSLCGWPGDKEEEERMKSKWAFSISASKTSIWTDGSFSVTYNAVIKMDEGSSGCLRRMSGHILSHFQLFNHKIFKNTWSAES